MRIALFLALLLFGGAGMTSAQTQYKGIPFPPYEFYEALLGYCQEGSLAALGRSIGYLSPLFEAIHEELEVDAREGIENSIRRADPAAAKRAVLRLIYLDLELNGRSACRAGSGATRLEFLQMAYTDYNFLSPTVRERDKSLDRSAKESFKQMYAVNDHAVVTESFERLLGRLSTVFEDAMVDEAH